MSLKFVLPESIAVRYLVCFATWLSLFSVYLQRVAMSIAILAMAPQSTNTSNATYSSCALINNRTSSTVIEYEFDWNQTQQYWILTSFLIGYLLAHFPGALISMRYGSRYTMLGCIIGSTLFTFLTVWLSSQGFIVMIIIRSFVGIFSGPLYPLVHGTIGAYAIPAETTKLTSFTHSANVISLIFNFGVGGYLVKYVTNGWRIHFYISGAIGVVSAIVWFIFGYSSPKENILMSDKEKDYIQHGMGGVSKHHKIKSLLDDIPYKKIFTSRHIYVLALAHYGKMSILYAQMMGAPKFLNNAYDVPIDQAGYFSIIPFFADFIFQFIFPFLIEYLRNNTDLSISAIRRISSCIGFTGSSVFLIPMVFFDCAQWPWVVVFLSVSLLFVPANQTGYFTSIIEISPKHAAISMGIINIFGSIAGVIQLQITSLFLRSGDRRIAYRNSYIVTSVVSFSVGMVYVLFGTSERQDWSCRSHNEFYMEEKRKKKNMKMANKKPALTDIKKIEFSSVNNVQRAESEKIRQPHSTEVNI